MFMGGVTKEEERPLCIRRHLEVTRKIAELLIEKGADVNLRSVMVIKTEDGDAGEQMAQKITNNRTPLDMAISFDHT